MKRRWGIPLGVLLSTWASAHDYRPGVLSLRETAPLSFELGWVPPLDGAGAPLDASPIWPPGCAEIDQQLRCAAFEGPLRFNNLNTARDRVLVVIRRLDGTELETPVAGPNPEINLSERSWARWVALGVEHLITGVDHLAFLIGLLMICGQLKRVALALTAFTLAHSLSLALSALRLVHLSAAPVEAAIALSVVLVAHEALGTTPTLTRRWPWAVALLFGLVHGFGFAGALGTLGLSGAALGRALLGFNVGLEAGQLALALIALSAARLLQRSVASGPARRLVAYGLGSAGVFWFFTRAAAIFTGPS